MSQRWDLVRPNEKLHESDIVVDPLFKQKGVVLVSGSADSSSGSMLVR